MAKKFGKILLAAAAVTTAAAATFYYLRKKDQKHPLHDEGDEDYDNFENEASDTDTASRTYVSLNNASCEDEACADGASCAGDDAFAHADGQDEKKEDAKAPETAAKEDAADTVEDFFDEDEPEKQ